MPAELARLPQDEVPLQGYDMVGLEALRMLLSVGQMPPQEGQDARSDVPPDLPRLDRLVDDLARAGRGLVMVMGKGGVGKTTIAAALAVGLARRGHAVHLSTTDPAAHVADVLDGSMAGLTVDRIDPVAETRRYIDKVMTTRGRGLDEQGKALLLEDLHPLAPKRWRSFTRSHGSWSRRAAPSSCSIRRPPDTRFC